MFCKTSVRSLFLTTTVLLPLLIGNFCARPANAQLGGILGGLGNKAKEIARAEAEKKIVKIVGEKMNLGSPLLLDQTTAFAPVENFTDFKPKLLSQDREAATTPLPVGDYAVPVRAYCTQWSIHVPGRGLPYKIAPLRGPAAPAIGALLMRGTMQGMSPLDLNAKAWRIQSGLPLSSWPASDRAVIHNLIPEYEKSLQGDYFQQIEATYNKYKKVLPPFETMLDKMGEAGKLYKTIRRGRQYLTDGTISAERLPEMLYEPTDDGLPLMLPDEATPQASPWSEIRPGVFGRFTVLEGNWGENRFEFRVTPAAMQKRVSAVPARSGFALVDYTGGPIVIHPGAGNSAVNSAVVGAGATALLVGPTVLEVLGVSGGAVAVGGAAVTAPAWVPVAAAGAGAVLIGYSMGRAAQALIIAPMINWANNQDGIMPPPVVKPLPTTGGATAAAPGGLDPDGEDPDDEDEPWKNANKMEQERQRGKAPKSVERVDKRHQNIDGKIDDDAQVHFKDGSALKWDGEWKHGPERPLTNAEKKWLLGHGWKLPK